MSDSIKIQSLENQINSVFPIGFEFYDLGRVIPDEQISPEGLENFPEGGMGVAFSIYPMNESATEALGFRTLLLTVFEEGLDNEVYVEIGNVIASRFAGGLSKLMAEEIMITPPLTLKPAAVQRLIRMKKQTLSRKRYFHSYQNKLIPIDVLVLRVEGEAKGNA